MRAYPSLAPGIYRPNQRNRAKLCSNNSHSDNSRLLALLAAQSPKSLNFEGVPPPKGHSPAELAEGLGHLRAGGVIAVPTDTLYGLAADVSDESALGRIFDIKGRPAQLALPVLVANWEQVEMVARVEETTVRQLGGAFWPGSLTLVLPKSSNLSPRITGGRDTVAVRMPGHWVPFYLANDLGQPITGTSANHSGQPDLKSVQELRDSLGNSVDAIIEAGPAPLGLQSTIVDLTGTAPTLLREGAVPFADVLRVWAALTHEESGDMGTGV